jgi:hypothetical protein
VSSDREDQADTSPQRVRYETYCGGRLLKVYDQVEVPNFHGGPFATREKAEAARREPLPGWPVGPVPVVDGQQFWKVDEQVVAADVAQAMLAAWPPEVSR